MIEALLSVSILRQWPAQYKAAGCLCGLVCGAQPVQAQWGGWRGAQISRWADSLTHRWFVSLTCKAHSARRGAAAREVNLFVKCNTTKGGVRAAFFFYSHNVYLALQLLCISLQVCHLFFSFFWLDYCDIKVNLKVWQNSQLS